MHYLNFRSCLTVLESIASQHGAFAPDQLAFSVVDIKCQLNDGLEHYQKESVSLTVSDDLQKTLISKLSSFLSTSTFTSELMYKEYLKRMESQGLAIKTNLYNIARTHQTLEEIRKIYWSDRLSLIQLQKIMASHWEPSWFSISDLLFGATNFRTYEGFTQMLIKQFGSLYLAFVGLLSKTFSTKVQFEPAVDAQILQVLREIELTLEAILISLSSGLEPSKSSERMFPSLLDSFWASLFFSKKELTCLSAVCRKIVCRIRNLQCFILIRSGQLEKISDEHFMKQHCNRLLASVSSLGKTQGHAPLLLLAAVCGSVFGSTEEELSKASDFASVVIQELDVFNYLCGILQDRNFSPSGSKSNAANLADFDVPSLPESLSVVSLCSHLAVFDLLTLLARQIAVDSLGEHRASFTRVLAKTLSVVIQCNCNMSAAESKLSRIGLGVTSVIEDLAQRFPLDLDLLYICIALLSTSVASYNHNRDEASIPDLVVQLISSVPYFAERFPEPSALGKLVQVHEPDEENGDIFVSLLRPYQCLPPFGALQFSMDKSASNHMAICLPAGTRGSLKQGGTVVVWQHDYSMWPVINAVFALAEYTLLSEQLNDQENVSYAISRLIPCLDFVDACLLTNVEPARCLALTELAWTLVTSIFAESLSGERETPIDQTLTTLSADHLLPCLLRLTAHSVTFTDSDNGIVYRLSGGVFRYLQSDRILCPSVVLRNDKHLFTLTDTCLLRIASSTNVAPSTAYRLVSAYLDLALSLLAAEKTAFFADAGSHFSESEEEESFARDDPSSPLLACLVFCFEFLIEAGGSPSRRISIIPRLIAGLPDSRTWVSSLVNKALLFFVELLTSYSMDNTSDDANDEMESAPPSVDSPIFHFRDLRSYAYWLLSNSESFLNCLISLTKVSVETLQIPLQSIDFDFLRFSTRPDEEQIGGASALGQHRVQSSWLALTLLHSLFPSHSTSAHFKTFLKVLSTNGAISGAYFLHLLNFLDPTCAVGLTRATVSFLKKLTQFSEFLVTPHLHDMQPRLLKFFTYRLRSPSADQVTRTALFDWLADVVMQDVLSGAACAPFNGPGFGLLRMVSSNSPKDSKVDDLQGILTTALKEAKGEDSFISVNLYWSLLKLVAAIWMQPNNLFRFQLRETADFWKLLDDPFSSHMTVLKKSKILASVVDMEIAGNYATIIAIELFEFLKSAQVPDSTFAEIVKQFVGEVLVQWIQVALQLPDGPDPSDFSKSPLMNALDWALIRWKSVFCALLKWNTSAADEKEHLISHGQIVNLVDSSLDKTSLWISLPQSRTTVSIIDQLAVSLAAAASYLVNSSEMSTLPVFEWIHRCIVLLEHRLFSPPSNQQSSTIIFSHFHADLFAFIALLLPKVSPPDLPPGLYERLLNLCLKIFQNVSLLPGISSADSQAFIQAMNVLQLIWKNFDAVKLAQSLIDLGIVNNLIAILAEHSTAFRGAEFCQAIFRLLTMFLLPFDGNRLYPDLSVVSHIGNSSSFSQKRDPLLLSRSPLAQMLLTYAPELVQSLRLPPVKQMMQWLAQAVEYSPNLETSQDEFYPNTSWSEFLLSQLRFLSLLVACGGGSGGDTPVGHLIRSFILANHEQLCALLTPVPARGLLIASAVLDLYWIALHSSSAGTKLSIPTCVASAALFGNGRRDSMPLPDGVSICLPNDVWNVVYSASVQLAGTCATLLLRPEIVDISKTSSPSSIISSNPSETITKASRLSISLKLLPILRLLNSCLRLIAVESPMLGDLSFVSASEIAALTPSATLNFAAPSTEPSNTLTFGLLFSVARTSSQLLVNISSSKIATDGQICRRRSELLSILVEVNELTFSLIFSQAVIWLMNPHIGVTEKHTLSRGLAVEFQSYNFLARSSRRARKSIGSHTPIKSTGSSPSASSGPFDSSESTVQQLHELFSFIDCAERFSDLVK